MILLLPHWLAQDPTPQDPQDPQAPEEAVDENLLLAKPVIATEETTGSLWNTNRASNVGWN